MNDEDHALVRKSLREVQKTDPEVQIILDTTAEDADWIHRLPPEVKEGEKRRRPSSGEPT